MHQKILIDLLRAVANGISAGVQLISCGLETQVFAIVLRALRRNKWAIKKEIHTAPINARSLSLVLSQYLRIGNIIDLQEAETE